MKKVEKSKKSAKNLDINKLEGITGGEVVSRSCADGRKAYFSTAQQGKVGKADLFYYKNEQEQLEALKKAKVIENQYAKKK